MRALGAALTLLTLVSCAPSSPTVSVSAPARLQRALSVVSDLGCQARLAAADSDDDVVVVDLERGDDGVTFSGFLEAPEGSYILELTFSGVASGANERRFLGRLRSDTIRVVDGDVATPAFSSGLDTIGGPDDGGDDDNDGLGFLDELILGSSPDDDDSDNDGIVDGDDCRPGSPVVAFAIADGGDVDDCDADGFIAVDPVFAATGNDCDDEDAAINPAAEDDCGTLSDEDCNPSTCPVNDAEGPRIVVSAPEDGGSAGCGSRIVAAIDDESGVESAFATFVDDPFDQSARIVVLNETATDGVWQSQPISLSAGLGFRDGAHLLEVKAFDGTGNSASVNVNFDLVTELADVSIAGPAVVSGSEQTVTFSASSDAAIVRFVVFSSTPSPQAPSTFDLSTQTLVDELPVTGGAVSLDPADFDERTVIYAIVEDADGRLSSPTLQDFTSVTDGRARATTCDGDFNATVPVVIVEPPPEVGDLASLTELLPEAVDAAVAIDASAQLSSIVALAIDGEGRVNLGDTGNFTRRWIFRFLKADGRGINVNYLSAAFAGARPQLDADVADPFDDEVMNAAADPSALADSTTLIALYESLGCGLYTGSDSESLVITKSGARDQAIMSAEGGQSLLVDAATLEVIVGCD